MAQTVHKQTFWKVGVKVKFRIQILSKLSKWREENQNEEKGKGGIPPFSSFFPPFFSSSSPFPPLFLTPISKRHFEDFWVMKIKEMLYIFGNKQWDVDFFLIF